MSQIITSISLSRYINQRFFEESQVKFAQELNSKSTSTAINQLIDCHQQGVTASIYYKSTL